MLIDTTKEIEEMQNELWMRRTTGERAEFMFGMFAAARQMIILLCQKIYPSVNQKTAFSAHVRRAFAR